MYINISKRIPNTRLRLKMNVSKLVKLLRIAVNVLSLD